MKFIIIVIFRDTVSGAYYPHVNMCVPIETVASIIKYFIKTNGNILRFKFTITFLLKAITLIYYKAILGLLAHIVDFNPNVKKGNLE
jgi:hypothetical protein